MFGIIRRFQVSKAWLCHKMSFQFSRTVICPLVSNIRDLLWKAEWNIHSWVFKSDLCVHHMYDQCVLHWVSPALPWQHQWYLDLLLIVFVKLNQNDHKYWDGNAIYTSVATAVPRCVLSSSSSSHVVPGAALHSLAPDTDSVTLSCQQCHTVLHCVTLCHTVSHCVTPCHTVSHTSGKSDWFLLIDFGLNLDLRTPQWKNMNVRNKFLTF